MRGGKLIDTRNPIPANYSVRQLRQVAQLVGAGSTACFYARGSLQLLYQPLISQSTALQPISLDLEGGCLVFIALFPIKEEKRTPESEKSKA